MFARVPVKKSVLRVGASAGIAGVLAGGGNQLHGCGSSSPPLRGTRPKTTFAD